MLEFQVVLDIRDLVACMESVELLVALESRERRYAPPTITCITCKAFDPLPGLFKIMLCVTFPSLLPKG